MDFMEISKKEEVSENIITSHCSQWSATKNFYLGYPAEDLEPVKNPSRRRLSLAERVFYHEYE